MIFNEKKSEIKFVSLSTLLNITSFHNQIDIDTDRVDKIIDYYKSKLTKGNLLFFDTCMVFVKDYKNQDAIMNNNNLRKNMCIVDGQHRLSTFKH